jgi:hypothetical protein
VSWARDRYRNRKAAGCCVACAAPAVTRTLKTGQVITEIYCEKHRARNAAKTRAVYAALPPEERRKRYRENFYGWLRSLTPRRRRRYYRDYVQRRYVPVGELSAEQLKLRRQQWRGRPRPTYIPAAELTSPKHRALRAMWHLASERRRRRYFLIYRWLELAVDHGTLDLQLVGRGKLGAVRRFKHAYPTRYAELLELAKAEVG